MMDLFELITALCACHGPSGDEEEIRRELARRAAPFADEIKTDAMGNLIVHRKGVGPRLMLCAHMDSIGFMVTRVEKEGFLRVGKIGGASPKEVVFSPLRFQNGVQGVLTKDEKAELGKLRADELLIDIGADSGEEAEKLVKPGDTAVFDGSAVRLGEHRIKAPYLDNRISCAVLLAVLEQVRSTAYDLYFVFSVQEEVGLRGAKTAAFAIEPDYSIAVDVTTADDVPGSEHTGTAALGKGAAIKIMDRSVICHHQMVAGLEAVAREQGISVQREVMTDGGTDAGAIHTSRGGVRTGGVSIPCRYIHTPVETADLRDAQSCVKLLAGFIEKNVNEGNDP